MQQKSNLGTLKDSQEFAEEKSQSPQDYYKVVKLLEKQVTLYLNVLLLTAYVLFTFEHL